MKRVPEYRLTLKRERSLAVAETVSSFNAATQTALAWYAAHEPAFESVILIGLNGKNRVIGVVEVSRGGMHGASLTPRDVLVPALVMGASAFVLAHNHPSGDPTPSREDIVMTAAIRAAADVVGCPLLDHVVVTADGRAESCP
jgi:DNA repair protein RadC